MHTTPLLKVFSQHNPNETLGAGVGLVLTGAVFFLIFWLIKKWQTNKDDHFLEAFATITNIERKNYNGNGINYYYTVNYRTNNGEEIETRLDYSTLFNKHEIGQQLSVFYNPNNLKQLFSLKGKEQKKMFYTLQRGVAFLFTLFGVVLLFNVNYNEDLDIVKWYRRITKYQTDSDKKLNQAFNCFENYINKEEAIGKAIPINICDSLYSSKDPQWKKLNTRFCFRSFNENNFFTSYLNNDTCLDVIYTFHFNPCQELEDLNFKHNRAYLILSEKNQFYVEDQFLNFSALDTLGEFRIDSVVNKTFYGVVKNRTNSKDSSLIKINYPVQEVVFLK